MADQGNKGVESATAAMAEVRLDENGQPLSKNALKKLLKKEAADKKKAEKAAARVSDGNDLRWHCNRYHLYAIAIIFMQKVLQS